MWILIHYTHCCTLLLLNVENRILYCCASTTTNTLCTSSSSAFSCSVQILHIQYTFRKYFIHYFHITVLHTDNTNVIGCHQASFSLLSFIPLHITATLHYHHWAIVARWYSQVYCQLLFMPYYYGVLLTLLLHCMYTATY